MMGMATELAAVLLAIALAVVHVGAGWLRFLQTVPRSVWLSIGSGVSVAYVFVHLLPEITARQAQLVESADRFTSLPLSTREHLLFLAVLLGFGAYYGVELFANRAKRENGQETTGSRLAGPSVFWVHIGAFAAYNLLIGYLLVHRERPGLGNVLLYATAMGMHFVVNDHGLRDHHRDTYDDVGRWVLAVAILLGLIVGYAVAVPELIVSLLFAFLAGGIVLNVIKEELPEERQSRFAAFAAGVGGYTIPLLAL